MVGWNGLCDGFSRFGPGHMWGWSAGGGILGLLGSLLGLVLILGLLTLFVLATVWLVRRSRTVTDTAPGGASFAGSPLDLAQRRLAAGDITLDEYHHIRDELRG